MYKVQVWKEDPDSSRVTHDTDCVLLATFSMNLHNDLKKKHLSSLDFSMQFMS